MTLLNNRIYGGYSLLLDVDYDAMVNVLKPNRKKIESKGIKSVRARVGQIRDALDPKYQDITIHEFKDLMIKQIMGIDDIKDAKRYELTDEDWAGIDQLVAEKYDERFSCGTIDISLSIEHNRIAACRIYGDFFGQGNIHDVEEHLIGTRMVKADLIERLNDIDLTFYFGNLSVEEFVSFILS